MKAKIIVLIIVMSMIFIPINVFAKEKYHGIEISGSKGTEWDINEDNGQQTVLVKRDGVSISGKATSDITILITDGVTNLELNELTQGDNYIYISSDDNNYTVNKFTLNIVGKNEIESIDIYEHDSNDTPDNYSDDIYYQADSLTVRGENKNKDTLTIKSDLVGGKEGLYVENVTIVAKEKTDKAKDTIEMGLTAQGPISILSSNLNLSWGIFSEGKVTIDNSQIDIKRGIVANCFNFNEATGEGKEEYFDIYVDDSYIVSEGSLIGNNIMFLDESKVSINLLDEGSEANYVTNGICSHGKVLFGLEGSNAYVVAKSKNENYWSICAEKGIDFRTDNGIKSGGNIIYVSESAYGLGKYTLEDDSKLIYSDLEVIYSKGIEAPRRVERIWGQSQYDTSYAIADRLKEEMGVDKFDAIIIASGKTYPDALSGSYLSKKENAPILLVDGKNSSNVSRLKEYIYNNLKKGGKIFILGGKVAVPQVVENGLDDYIVERLGGYTQYDTNLIILEKAGIENQDVLICTGENYADGLSCSSIGMPILLVNKSLTNDQKQLLSNANGENIYIIGGNVAVKPKIESQAKEISSNVERIGGWSKYDTSIMIAEEFGKDANTAVIAWGNNFPDALCGGPLAMKLDAPLILVADNNSGKATSFVKKNSIRKGTALGGGAVLKDATIKNVFGMGNREVIISNEYK